MDNLMEIFFTDDDKGTCKSDLFEFGNTHRQVVKCMYCINNKCHYIGECDRRNKDFSGWDIA